MRLGVVTSLTVPANTSIRVALAWQACMLEELSTPVLNNDLDLSLSCGSPITICGGTITSDTVTSELETLHKPACSVSKGCSIRVRIKNGAPLASCGSTTTERVGVAWSFNN